ncbi:MAG: VPLPA-CTERM sorting domain-containing protein [Gammaproteobacteria bacterium]
MIIKGKAAGSLAAIAGLLLLVSGNANALLTNGGFEADDASGGDVGGATGWTTFEGVFTNNTAGPSFGPVSHDVPGSQSLKMFGPFTGTGSAAGAFQNVAGTAGQAYTLEAWVMNWVGDPFGNLGILQLNFLDSGGNGIGGSEVTVDPFGTADVDLSVIQDGAEVTDWTQLSLTGIAPAGTAEVQAFLLHIQTGDPCCSGGSLFWDDVSLTAVPVPAAVWLFGSALGILGWMRRKTA